jgi:hypothetical protein
LFARLFDLPQIPPSPTQQIAPGLFCTAVGHHDILVGKLGRSWVPKQIGRAARRLVLDRRRHLRRPLLKNVLPLGQTRHLLKLQYKSKRNFDIVDVTAASRMVQPIGNVAPSFPLPAFCRQVLFHKLADIGQRVQRRDGRNF